MFNSFDGVSSNDKELCQSSSIDDECSMKIDTLSSSGYSSDGSLNTDEDGYLQHAYDIKKNLKMLKSRIMMTKFICKGGSI